MLVPPALITVMCISIVMLWIIVVILISHIKKNTLFLSQLKLEENKNHEIIKDKVEDLKEFDNKVIQAKLQVISENNIPSLDKYIKRRV